MLPPAAAPRPPPRARPLPRPPPRLALALALLLLLLALSNAPTVAAAAAAAAPVFDDVTAQAGLAPPSPKLKKYGGPTVADLDNDGYPDLLLCHHDSSWVELYFNSRNATFVKHPLRLWTDMHGVVVVPRSPHSRARRFTVSSGGNFGKQPATPLMFHVDPARAVVDVSRQAPVHKVGGRGRTAVFMHLKLSDDHRNPDLLFTNAHPADPSNFAHFAYLNTGLRYDFRRLPGYEHNHNWYAMPADVDNDGQMELISFQNFSVHKLVAPFTFRDVTDTVLPASVPRIAVVAVAEFDFDNDGDMDLYVARTNSGDLDWIRGTSFPDLLLENRGGTFVDVSATAGLPSNSASRGVTTADFNNDGFMDIFIPQYVASDITLLNNGDGTFTRVDGLVSRPPDVRGDHAVAVDYDMDGRVDLIVAQGDQHDLSLGGSYRIFRNALPPAPERNFLHVRVGVAPDHSATALHALVTVVAGPLRMTKRVGSPGDAVSRSFLETVHFGLADSEFATVIRVAWTNGVASFKWNVPANGLVEMGVVL